LHCLLLKNKVKQIKKSKMKKAIIEKGTGEKYASKLSMVKHEKNESKSTQKKESKKGKAAVAMMMKYTK